MRYGELTAFEERPHSPYFGNADATPLFVVLLDEYERWTGDTALVRELEHGGAGGAATGSTTTPTCTGNGYISYQRRNEQTGLENQCWKDSWDSISLPRRPAARLPAGDLRAAGVRLRREDARRPAGPRRSGTTRPTRTSSSAGGRPQARASTATSGSTTASTSRSRSTRTARQVDALSSNIGHLLWSGIVDADEGRRRRART